MARRRDGWSFLIADEDDLKTLNRLTMDGETVLASFSDELIDVSALAWANYIIDQLIPVTQATYRGLNQHCLRNEANANNNSLTSLMGMPPEVLHSIMAISPYQED